MLLAKPLIDKDLFSKNVKLLVVAGALSALLLAVYFCGSADQILMDRKIEYLEKQHNAALHVVSRVEGVFDKTMQGVVVISSLPQVRGMDPAHANGNDRELMQNLCAQVFDPGFSPQVSFVPSDFNLVAEDAGLFLLCGNTQPSEEVMETYNYRLLLDQLAAFRQEAPASGKAKGVVELGVGGHIAEYSSAHDKYQRLFFMAPVYGTDGHFSGMVSAMLPVAAVRPLLNSANALVNTSSPHQVITPDPMPDLMKASFAFVEKAVADTSLPYSETFAVHLPDASNGWVLWSGAGNAAMLQEAPNVYTGSVLISLMLMIGVFIILLMSRNYERIRNALQSAKQSAESVSKEKSELLGSIINTTVDALVTINDAGVIQMFNPAAERLFGYKEQEVLGQNVSVLMPEPHRTQHGGYIGNYLHTRKAKIIGSSRQAEGLRKDGTTFPLELFIGEVVQGNKRMFCGIMRDITERVQSEHKILNYAAQIQSKSLDMASAREQAEEATRIKSEFVANVSHEIRSNISGIIGLNNLLLDSNLAPKESQYARAVRNSAESLLQVINDILDLSKIESGRIELDHIAFDLKLLCEEIFSIINFRTDEKRIELLMRYPANVPHRMIGDPGRIRQILLNLLNNAVKFTDKGHVLLLVECKAQEGNQFTFHITVEDTGIGIPADRLDYVFDKFNKTNTSGDQISSGGLGLSICRELCRIMGGNIGVRSEAGKGSAFWFEVTLAEDKGETEMFSEARESLLSGLKVLVVDDNEMARIILHEQLTPYGIQITDALSGEQALLMLAGGQKFDVAIIDLMLPGMDGIVLGKSIKEKKFGGNMVSMIMLTSIPTRGDIQRVEEAGFTGYLNKAASQEQLREALCIIAEARRRGRKIAMITQHSIAEAKEERQRQVNKNLHFTSTRILLVEDNPIGQAVSTAMLEKYGCHVTVAANGDEALQQLGERSFDMVFMDCQMPVMDGFETTILIRKLEEHQVKKRLPIVALTADSNKGTDKQCFAAGMNDYITKPVRQSELERMLVKWVSPEKQVVTTPEMETQGDLDTKIFEGFRELMNENSAEILLHYIDSSRGFANRMKASFDAKDVPSLHNAARSLEVASRQIGAVKVASVASAIAELCKTSTPEMEKLRALIERLALVRQAAEKTIEGKLKDGAYAPPITASSRAPEALRPSGTG